MKYNIVAISPAGATLTFHDVEALDFVANDYAPHYLIFDSEAKDAEPVGIVPATWAISRREVEEVPAPKDFQPIVLKP